MNKPCQITALSLIRQACQIQTTFLSRTWLYLKDWLFTLSETSPVAVKVISRIVENASTILHLLVQTWGIFFIDIKTGWYFSFFIQIGLTVIWRGGGGARKMQDVAHDTCWCSILSPTHPALTVRACTTVATVIFHAWSRKKKKENVGTCQ